jgi:hypothetical protein
MLFLIIIGYITLAKCCLISTLMIFFGPWLYRQVRRARRPDAGWVPTNKNIIKKLLTEKFNKDQHEEGSECVICFV